MQVGDTAPDFELLNDLGEPVRLSSFQGEKVVVIFYPADDTQAAPRRAVASGTPHEEFKQAGAAVFGVVKTA